MELPGGNRRPAPPGRRSRLGAVAAAAAVAALALSVAACGDDSSPGSGAAAGSYRVKVVSAKFPTRQLLGETTLLRIGVRNTGARTVPALTVTISIAGEAGQTSSLPFAIRDAEPGLAQPDRPVWALSARYPRLAGSPNPAGADTSSIKTYDFGPLAAGETTEAVWKLTASRTGRYTLLYEVGAGLSGEATAETAAGVEPGGSFTARIGERPPDTIVTDSGEVVELPKKQERSGR